MRPWIRIYEVTKFPVKRIQVEPRPDRFWRKKRLESSCWVQSNVTVRKLQMIKTVGIIERVKVGKKGLPGQE